MGGPPPKHGRGIPQHVVDYFTALPPADRIRTRKALEKLCYNHVDVGVGAAVAEPKHVTGELPPPSTPPSPRVGLGPPPKVPPITLGPVPKDLGPCPTPVPKSLVPFKPPPKKPPPGLPGYPLPRPWKAPPTLDIKAEQIAGTTRSIVGEGCIGKSVVFGTQPPMLGPQFILPPSQH